MSKEVLIPRLSVNDDLVTIGEWLVKEGSSVKKGQDIVVFETTKETVEGQANADGFIHIMIAAGEEKEVGTVIATITDNNYEEKEVKCIVKLEDDRQYTKKAKILIEKYGIDTSHIVKKGIIREKDIESLISKPYQIRETNTNELSIYGGGGFAHVIIDILKQTCAYRLLGIVDMKYPELKDVSGVEVLGNDEYLNYLLTQGNKKIVNAVGYPDRAKAYDKLKGKGFELPNLIHKSAVIEPSVTMGEGNLIFANAMVGSETIIGSDCVINVGAVVNHECIISDNVHVASGAILAGGVTVGENSMIGQGVTIYQRVKIGRNVVIMNGVNVFSDVPDGGIIKAK